MLLQCRIAADGANPFGSFGFPDVFGASAIPGMGQMQQELMANPEMLRQLMESPLIQGIMNNPEIIRSMLNANPQIQQLLEVKNYLY